MQKYHTNSIGMYFIMDRRQSECFSTTKIVELSCYILEDYIFFIYIEVKLYFYIYSTSVKFKYLYKIV